MNLNAPMAVLQESRGLLGVERGAIPLHTPSHFAIPASARTTQSAISPLSTTHHVQHVPMVENVNVHAIHQMVSTVELPRPLFSFSFFVHVSAGFELGRASFFMCALVWLVRPASHSNPVVYGYPPQKVLFVTN